MGTPYQTKVTTSFHSKPTFCNSTMQRERSLCLLVFPKIQLCCKYLKINTCTQLFQERLLSPTVQLHTANAETTPSLS